MNTLMQWDTVSGQPATGMELEGQAVSLAMASEDISRAKGGSIDQRMGGMSFGVGVLLMAIVANVLAGVHLVTRRRRPSSHAGEMYVVDHSIQYGAVRMVEQEAA